MSIQINSNLTTAEINEILVLLSKSGEDVHDKKFYWKLQSLKDRTKFATAEADLADLFEAIRNLGASEFQTDRAIREVRDAYLSEAYFPETSELKPLDDKRFTVEKIGSQIYVSFRVGRKNDDNNAACLLRKLICMTIGKRGGVKIDKY